jgi:hypothetical protein
MLQTLNRKRQLSVEFKNVLKKAESGDVQKKRIGSFQFMLLQLT